MSMHEPAPPESEDEGPLVESVEWADGNVLILSTDEEGEWVQADSPSDFVDLEDCV